MFCLFLNVFFKVFNLTSLLLRETEGRKSFSILSMARTISSNTLLCLCSFTTFTCCKNIQFVLSVDSNLYFSKVCLNQASARWCSHSDTEEGADRFVITGLQLHVTLVFELLDVVSPPQNSVTPGRNTTLPATWERKLRPWKQTFTLNVSGFFFIYQ